MAEIRLVIVRMLMELEMNLFEETGSSWPGKEAYLTWDKRPLPVKRAIQNDVEYSVCKVSS